MNFKTFLANIISNIIGRFRMLPISPNNYRLHILDTYSSTRIGIAIIGILFPLILWFIGLMLGIELQGSISAYYHTPMRNVFVGILFAIGASLYLYKGYSTIEDFVLDCAGILALCIALLPTSPATELECDPFTAPYLHGISAISFFILIAYICIFRASDTLDQSEIDESRKSFYKIIYWILGVSMIALPLFSALWLYLVDETGSLIFWVESVGVWVFSLYWIVKTIEIKESHLEEMNQFCPQPNRSHSPNSDRTQTPNQQTKTDNSQKRQELKGRRQKDEYKVKGTREKDSPLPPALPV